MLPDATAAQLLAERAHDTMFEHDAASHGLGIEIATIGPGHATATMTIRPDMLNGFGMCHGGFIVTLADTAFAFACNSFNVMTLACGLDAEFLLAAQLGDVLTARAEQRSQAGRLGVTDVVVTNQRGEQVALVRGRSYRVKGKAVAP